MDLFVCKKSVDESVDKKWIMDRFSCTLKEGK